MVEVLTTAGTHITTFAVSEPDDFGPGPAWSADGRWIAHLDGSQVVLVPVGGGANRILSLDATGVAGVPALGPDFTFAGWSPDGERFLLVGAVPDAGNVLLSIPIDPGTSGLALTKGTAAIRGSAREISWQPVFP